MKPPTQPSKPMASPPEPLLAELRPHRELQTATAGAAGAAGRRASGAILPLPQEFPGACGESRPC